MLVQGAGGVPGPAPAARLVVASMGIELVMHGVLGDAGLPCKMCRGVERAADEVAAE